MKKLFVKVTLTDSQKEVFLSIHNIVGIQTVDGGTLITTNSTAVEHRSLKVKENAEHLTGKLEGRF